MNSQYPPGSMSPSQLGVRPAPALVQQLLIGAFGWMFAGLLLTAAVAYLTTTSTGLMATVESFWFLLLTLLVRIHWEEQALGNYRSYARQVRWRMLPGIW